MARKDESKKDQIILQQMEVIRSMTEHNLRRMGTDFWGTPAPARPPETAGTSREETSTGSEKQREAEKNSGTGEEDTAGKAGGPAGGAGQLHRSGGRQTGGP